MKGTSREGMRHGTYYDGALLRSRPFSFFRVPTDQPRSTPMHHGEVAYWLQCASLVFCICLRARAQRLLRSQSHEHD